MAPYGDMVANGPMSYTGFKQELLCKFLYEVEIINVSFVKHIFSAY